MRYFYKLKKTNGVFYSVLYLNKEKKRKSDENWEKYGVITECCNELLHTINNLSKQIIYSEKVFGSALP